VTVTADLFQTTTNKHCGHIRSTYAAVPSPHKWKPNTITEKKNEQQRLRDSVPVDFISRTTLRSWLVRAVTLSTSPKKNRSGKMAAPGLKILQWCGMIDGAK
jgi:hypothetical protein